MIAGIPQNIILQTGNGQNLVSWNAVVGASSYSVQRSIDGVTFSTVGFPTINGYTDSTVTVGTQYYYQVASVNVSGTSPYNASYPLAITPCLPGQINLGYLRYMAQLRADKLNSQYLTTDEWNYNINQSANELYDLLVDKYGDDYFFAPSLLIQLTGQTFYPLPDGFNYGGAPALYKLNGIDSNVGGGTTGPSAGWIPLARANWSDRDNFTTWPGQAGALNNLYKMSYRTMGNNLFLFPVNNNVTIQLWYVPILKQMLQETDMISFSISGWCEFVIIDAAMKAMIKEESELKWNMLDETKSSMIERIEVSASNRDVGQPNSVSNTRRSMGDAGFSDGWGGFGGGGFGGSGWDY